MTTSLLSANKVMQVGIIVPNIDDAVHVCARLHGEPAHRKPRDLQAGNVAGDVLSGISPAAAGNSEISRMERST